MSHIKTVISKLEELYPLKNADTSWDNVGLLVDCLESVPPNSDLRVLLCIDLTAAVCEEAVSGDYQLIIAYHPFIFKGIKAISNENPQHRSLKRLITRGISVYSPHTAVDAAQGGVNDFMASIFNFKSCVPIQKVSETEGYGRILELKSPLSITNAVDLLKSKLEIGHVQVVKSVENQEISTVALCAGSGGSVLAGVKADLWFTGELSHHEMLYLKESGVHAVICGHWATERLFLYTLKSQLESAGIANVGFQVSKQDSQPFVYM